MKTLDATGVKADLLARLRQVTPASPRQWGRMTVHQMICHLSDSFRAVAGERAVSSPGIRGGPVIKYIALYAPMQWPHGVKTGPEVDQEVGGTKPVEFERDKSDLAALIERFARPDQDFGSYRHPAFGRMSRTQWQRWAYLHVDHHLRQFGA